MKLKNIVKTLVIDCASFPEGINACIVLNTGGMHYCGYLEFPEKLIDVLNPVQIRDFVYALNVHGGVTYDELEGNKRIVGFDCNHWSDYTLYREGHKSHASHHMFPTPPSARISALEFRTQTYVIKELHHIVTSLEEIYNVTLFRKRFTYASPTVNVASDL